MGDSSPVKTRRRQRFDLFFYSMLEFRTDTVDTGFICSVYLVISTRWVGFNIRLLPLKS